VQMKSGKVNSGLIRDFRGTLERENAAMGIFVTLDTPTKDMEQEALSAGFYEHWGKDYPRIQIVTIEELLNGNEPKLPSTQVTFKKAEKIKKPDGKQGELGL